MATILASSGVGNGAGSIPGSTDIMEEESVHIQRQVVSEYLTYIRPFALQSHSLAFFF